MSQSVSTRHPEPMRRWAAVVIGLDLCLIAGALLFVTGESSARPGTAAGVVALVVWWSVPVLVLLLMRTRAGLAVASGTLVVGSALALRSIYASTSPQRLSGSSRYRSSGSVSQRPAVLWRPSLLASALTTEPHFGAAYPGFVSDHEVTSEQMLLLADPTNTGDRMKALKGLLRFVAYFGDEPAAPHDVFVKAFQKYTESPCLVPRKTRFGRRCGNVSGSPNDPTSVRD